MKTSRFSRRTVLKGAGVLAASSVLLGSVNNSVANAAIDQAAPPSEAGVGVLPAIVDLATPQGGLGLRSTRSSERATPIRFLENATFVRVNTAPGTTIATFMRGDEVVAEGQRSTDGFLVAKVTTMFRNLEGEVVSRQGDLLIATQGSVLLTPDTRLLDDDSLIAVPLQQLQSGQKVVATTWRDPVNGQLIAAQIGVKRS